MFFDNNFIIQLDQLLPCGSKLLEAIFLLSNQKTFKWPCGIKSRPMCNQFLCGIKREDQHIQRSCCPIRMTHSPVFAQKVQTGKLCILSEIVRNSASGCRRWREPGHRRGGECSWGVHSPANPELPHQLQGARQGHSTHLTCQKVWQSWLYRLRLLMYLGTI